MSDVGIVMDHEATIDLLTIREERHLLPAEVDSG